jgi:ribonuclease PH
MSTTASIEEVNSTRRRFRITVAQDAVKTAFKSAVSQVQGTAEGAPFDRALLDSLLNLAVAGCAELTQLQKQALSK